MLKWLASFFKRKPKEEPVCEHCGGFMKYHAWSDCTSDRAMLHTMSTTPSPKAKAFYDSIDGNKGVDTIATPGGHGLCGGGSGN